MRNLLNTAKDVNKRTHKLPSVSQWIANRFDHFYLIQFFHSPRQCSFFISVSFRIAFFRSSRVCFSFSVTVSCIDLWKQTHRINFRMNALCIRTWDNSCWLCLMLMAKCTRDVKNDNINETKKDEFQSSRLKQIISNRQQWWQIFSQQSEIKINGEKNDKTRRSSEYTQHGNCKVERNASEEDEAKQTKEINEKNKRKCRKEKRNDRKTVGVCVHKHQKVIW